MRFVLVDLQTPGHKVNREHAGGFGAAMQAKGLAGQIVKFLKKQLVHLPVFSMAYTAAILREEKHEVLLSHGKHMAADVVLIASSMCAHDEEKAFAKKQKQTFPDCRVGYFGALPTTRPDLFEPADFIIRGEVESAIMAFTEQDHDFTGQLDYGTVDDLNALPAPDWAGFNPESFSYFPLLDKRPILPVQSSRGCAHACSYCSYMPVQTSRYRRRDPLAVVAEMENGVRRFKAQSFLFRDICFSLNRSHALDTARAIKERLPGIEWACETRVDSLDRELVDIMWDAGLRGVNLGIESPDESILGQSGKRAPDFEHQLDILSYMMDRGIRINAFYMLGLMGDTPESMKRTIEFAEEINTLGAQYCVLTPFPGIPLYDELKDRLLTDDLSQYNEFTPVVNIGTATPEEVETALARAYGYYFRTQWMKRYGPKTFLRCLRNVLSGLWEKTR